jgi:pimeloyl-ACP methyl ester carboxylesterase
VYDWRLDLGTQADQLAANIEAHSTPSEPATIVGHSAGGLVACLAWARLVAHGTTNLCRRIISICSPFQGSYGPIQWLSGLNPSVQQLLALGALPGQAGSVLAQWQLAFLGNLAATWPSFYELFPALGGTDAVGDPARVALYDATNYPPALAIDQNWLNFSRFGFQPGIAGPDTFPPPAVMTCVVSTGLTTAYRLLSAARPLNLTALGVGQDGDGIVTATSQERRSAAVVYVTGSHASVPLGITTTGLLARLILDPRTPPTPAPPAQIVTTAVPVNSSDPPESNYLTGLVCIGGG